MSSAELDRWIARLDGALEGGGHDDDARRREVARLLFEGFPLRIAPELLARLRWPYRDLTHDWSPLGWPPFVGSTLRVGPFDAARERRRERHRAWSQTVLRAQAPNGADWPALVDADELLGDVEQEAAHEAIARALAHHSLLVRGYGWLAAWTAHERGAPIALGLASFAEREVPELAPLAAEVLSTYEPDAAIAHLLERALGPEPSRAVDDALHVLRARPPTPFEHLASRVEHHVRAHAHGDAMAVWCRLAPAAALEIVSWIDEQEPAVHTDAQVRRAAKRGHSLPSTIRTNRACQAIDALTAGAARLPDVVVEALVARADDPAMDSILLALGPRARAAAPRLAARKASHHTTHLLATIGGPEAIAALERALDEMPETYGSIGALGADAVPLLRRGLARLPRGSVRTHLLRTMAFIARPELAPELWSLTTSDDESTVSYALAGLVRSGVVANGSERSRVADAFLRFQPSEWASSRPFATSASALAAALPSWIDETVAAGDELLVRRLLRVFGFLREWAREGLPRVERSIAASTNASHHEELARARDRIASPPPMFRPNR